jgi:hypothetical protein
MKPLPLLLLTVLGPGLATMEANAETLAYIELNPGFPRQSAPQAGEQLVTSGFTHPYPILPPGWRGMCHACVDAPKPPSVHRAFESAHLMVPAVPTQALAEVFLPKPFDKASRFTERSDPWPPNLCTQPISQVISVNAVIFPAQAVQRSSPRELPERHACSLQFREPWHFNAE